MAKQVSQETFDEVVKENISDFEMSPEEAVEDAVSQFEAQGVNLSNIVKDLSLYSGDGDTEHKVVSSLKTLKNCAQSAENLDETVVINHLTAVKSECDIDLAHRCLAGKNDAYPILMGLMAKIESNKKLLKACAETMVALMKGQPDLLDNEGVSKICKYLGDNKSDVDMADVLVTWIHHCCVMHEQNRQDFVTEGLIPLLVSVMVEHKQNGQCVRDSCAALRVLTFDDDVRVPFGKAHEHAKLIVTEANALKTILDISQEYATDPAVLGELFATLSKLAVRNEFCQEIMDLGGVRLMLNTLEKNLTNQSLTRQVLGVLKAVAGNDEVKVAIVEAGGVELIVTAIDKHIKQSAVCETGCAALATLNLRKPGHCAKVMECGGPGVIVKAMQLHPDEVQVQKQACMALRNLVARTREHCQVILELGAEALICEARRRHKAMEDEGKAALRDLGCNVDLKERWTGEGQGITH